MKLRVNLIDGHFYISHSQLAAQVFDGLGLAAQYEDVELDALRERLVTDARNRFEGEVKADLIALAEADVSSTQCRVVRRNFDVLVDRRAVYVLGALSGWPVRSYASVIQLLGEYEAGEAA